GSLRGHAAAGTCDADRHRPRHRDDLPANGQSHRGCGHVVSQRSACCRPPVGLAERRDVGDRWLRLVPSDLAHCRVGLDKWGVSQGTGAMTVPVLELRDIRKGFGAADVIRGVNLSIMACERHALIGPNGAGKSTLFNLISGCMRPDTGAITLKGSDITAM